MSVFDSLLGRNRNNGAAATPAAPAVDREAVLSSDPLLKSLGSDAQRAEDLIASGDPARVSEGIELMKSITARTVEGYEDQLLKSAAALPPAEEEDEDAPAASTKPAAFAPSSAPAPAAGAPAAPAPAGGAPAGGANDPNELDKWAADAGEGEEGDDEGIGVEKDDDEEDQPLAKSLQARYAEAKLAKGIGAIVEEFATAQANPELGQTINAEHLTGALIKSAAALEVKADVTNNYLEQIGGLENHTFEGVKATLEGVMELAKSIAADREQAAADREEMRRMHAETREFVQAQTQQWGQMLAPLAKSLNQAAPLIQQHAQAAAAPVGTPVGSAPLDPASVANPLLAMAANNGALNKSVDGGGDEPYNGWTRTDLKKSISDAFRNDREGVTQSDYELVRDASVPLSQLPERIFKAANEERASGG